jgi:hypothetical protein
MTQNLTMLGCPPASVTPVPGPTVTVTAAVTVRPGVAGNGHPGRSVTVKP